MTAGKTALFTVLAAHLLLMADVTAQIRVAPDRYRVEFIDKEHGRYSIDRPGEFLSERSLLRRARQRIAVTHDDLPVSDCYLDSLRRMNIEVLNVSRWLNSAVIRCPDAAMLKDVGFIRKTVFIPRKLPKVAGKLPLDLSSLFRREDRSAASLYGASPDYYGQSANQTGMLNGHLLHEHGYRGKGMLIAVIDGGFYRAGCLSGFAGIRENGMTVKNFGDVHDSRYGSDKHGANVLSIIASNLPGRMVGSAPDARYILLRSEEPGSEYIVEEDNWIAAVEYADSIGVDLITSSLGYSTFDDSLQNHVPAELDGRTACASRAAAMAAARGMIVCISAGNDGNKAWKYVSVPADADSIVAVGAVNMKGDRAAFSSRGATADGRIKPDLMAMGEGTGYQSYTGSIDAGNGTSYAAPLLAGFMACLWQAFPEKSNMEIIRMAKQSANRHATPDSLYGYGIPDFGKLLPGGCDPGTPGAAYRMTLLPGTSGGGVTLLLSPARHGTAKICVRTVTGRTVYAQEQYVTGCNACELTVEEKHIAVPGVYIIESETDAGRTRRIMHR
ncbi:MAG: S8 family serine peptidase [Bacteroidales bacterium]|jgi:hypothetical protein|nr:S8 family serine peptidase [Bacteroidales bacterium]